MSEVPGTPPRPASVVSWVLFVGGLAAVPCIALTASRLSQPAWDWDTSTFGRLFALPLLGLCLVACLVAPFLRPMSPGRRLALAAAGLVCFAFVLAATLAVCAFTFGTGIG